MDRLHRRPYVWAAAMCLLVILGSIPATRLGAATPTGGTSSPLSVEVVITGLDTPWELAWGADGKLYLTERSGRIRVWDGGRLETLASLPVEQTGEAGLMGLALDPHFPETPYIYTCYTYDETGLQTHDGGGLQNRIDRLRLEHGRLIRDRVILEGMQGATIHDGCRLTFAPDGTLLATMGDASSSALAQNLQSRNGKVLRIRPDGSIPSDNPFPDSPVYTLGHRNPQGLAVRPETHQIYISEHGPNTDDEINRLLPGRNYRWPQVRGKRRVDGYDAALWAWTPTIAPAGIAFLDRNTLYMATLKNSSLYRLTLDQGGAVIKDEVVLTGYGRLRALTVGPDRCIYVGTSNRDGRGQVRSGDDKVLRVCQAPNSPSRRTPNAGS